MLPPEIQHQQRQHDDHILAHHDDRARQQSRQDQLPKRTLLPQRERQDDRHQEGDAALRDARTVDLDDGGTQRQRPHRQRRGPDSAQAAGRPPNGDQAQGPEQDGQAAPRQQAGTEDRLHHPRDEEGQRGLVGLHAKGLEGTVSLGGEEQAFVQVGALVQVGDGGARKGSRLPDVPGQSHNSQEARQPGGPLIGEGGTCGGCGHSIRTGSACAHVPYPSRPSSRPTP